MNIIRFPTYNVSLGEAITIVRERLDDDSIALQTKMIAIEKVTQMETYNSIRKDDLVNALRYIFDHYDFEGVYD